MACSFHNGLFLKTQSQRTATLVTWRAGTLDLLVIKGSATGVLMLFLTSQPLLPVILNKAIIQNVVRSLFDKSWLLQHQGSLLFALLWVRNKTELTTPLMSYFYQVGDAVFLLSFCIPVMQLFERNESISNVLWLPKVWQSCCYYKNDRPFGQETFFLKVLSTFILFPSPWKHKNQFL